MTTAKILLSAVLMGVFFISSCSTDKDDSTDEIDTSSASNTGWLARAEVPNNEFKPTKIEMVVNNLVLELNKHEQNNTMKLSFIPKDLAGYFSTTIEGANDAFSELGVINTVIAPSTGMDEILATQKQMEYIVDHTENGYHGIGLASMAVDLVPAINAAVDAGISFVTFDSDESTSKRHFYVGTINSEAGKTAAHSILNLIEPITGTVIILGTDDEGWTGGYNRTHEARKVLEAAGNSVSVIHTDWLDQNKNEAALLTAMQTASPNAVGCLGVFVNAYLCATAAKKAGIIDAIEIAAFDFDPTTLALMQTGEIQLTHVQRQYYMGYLIPYILYAADTLGIEPTKQLISDVMVDNFRIDTGLDIIPANKLEDYNNFLNSLGL